MNSGSASQEGLAAIALAPGLPAGGTPDSRDLFLAALDISADLIYIVDAVSGRFIEVNQTTCSALGYAREELLAMTVADVQLPASAAGVKERLAELAATRPATSVRRIVLRRKNGSEFPTEIHARAVERGRTIVVVSVARDISESQRVEDELRCSEERFFNIFRSSPAAMAVGTVDGGGRLIDVNDRYVEFFGWSRDELVGSTTDERGIWIDPRQRIELIDRIRSGQTIRNIEVSCRKKSGEVAVTLLSMEIVPLRGQPVLVTMRVDITGRKRMEEALQRSEERFALFMQHLPGAAFIKDAHGRYVYANRRCEISQRVQPGGSAGKTDDELFSAETARQFKASDRQVFDSGSPIATIESAIWDDEVQHFLVNKFPIPASQGSSPLLGGAAFNITELKRSEAALRQALEERERLARDLHDGIVQDIYAVGLGLEETQHNLAQDARLAADGLARAIAGLNEVIRKLRTHIIGSVPQIIDGHQLSAELQGLARSLGAHRLQFRLEIDQDAVSRLTPDAIDQVLNIVREAMSNGLRHSSGRHGLVSLRSYRRGVRVVVEDDGVGFKRERASVAGRGLRNMAARASQLDARLDILSGPGSGTRITLDIPAKNADAVR